MNTTWPILRDYTGAYLRRISMPLGGIGTGTVGLGGRGDLRDWELMNRPAKGYTPETMRMGPALLLRAEAPGEEAVVRCLEGVIPPEDYEGQMGCTLPNHGLPRFRECTFAAAYPLAQVALADPDVPLRARIEAFNPLIPPDVERSGIPVAVLRVVLANDRAADVTATVACRVPNCIGRDEPGKPVEGNRNERRAAPGVDGIFMAATKVEATAREWGTMAIAVLGEGDVSCRTHQRNIGWGSAELDFWDEFTAAGRLTEPADLPEEPVGVLAAHCTVPAHGERTVTFLLAWHFPNRRAWQAHDACDCQKRDDIVGNWYTTQYADAWEVVERTAPALPALEAETTRFVATVVGSDLPLPVREAALFNLSTLRSQTLFRTPDGHFFGWEGCCDNRGCCFGSCTHVWNYEQATPFLFGPIARDMREIEFAHATDDHGLMTFRVLLPLDRVGDWRHAAADGQMGCLIKLYRDWQLSGDDAWLRQLWPAARRALEFCWIPGGWDGDADGVMEGCQHNTMDVEYFGPNPQMEGWYLGALRAVEEMARHLGDTEFADRCRELFAAGRAWTDANLFNGEYYEHQVRAPKSAADIAPGLQLSKRIDDPTNPDYQLAAGCLVDQMVGQMVAHLAGLGDLLDPDHVGRALDAVWKYNRREGMHGHYNCLRSFALGDETALLMASYPKGRPVNPFPYFTEVMTGFEHTAAIGLVQAGREDLGIQAIADVRARYDGRRRNPFDEAECGHHYARAMAAWGAVNALTGFQYSAVTGELRFAARPGRCVWAAGNAWGELEPTADTVILRVLGGELRLTRVIVGEQRHELAAPRTITAGHEWRP